MNEEEKFTSDDHKIDISPNKDKGIMKEIITKGEDGKTPAINHKVFINYTCSLMDGTKLESNIDTGLPCEFTLGKNEVIKAWDIAVATMTLGEISLYYCNPEYTAKSTSVPENSTLLYEIHLLKWEKEDLSPEKDQSILRCILLEGDGKISPVEGSNIKASIVGSFKDEIFDERCVNFELGKGTKCDIPVGIEIALQSFKKNEKSEISLKHKYAFGSSGSLNFNLPLDATVEYNITLHDFEKPIDVTMLKPCFDSLAENSAINKNFSEFIFVEASLLTINDDDQPRMCGHHAFSKVFNDCSINNVSLEIEGLLKMIKLESEIVKTTWENMSERALRCMKFLLKLKNDSESRILTDEIICSYMMCSNTVEVQNREAVLEKLRRLYPVGHVWIPEEVPNAFRSIANEFKLDRVLFSSSVINSLVS